MAEYIDREALEVELNHRLAFLMAENGEYDQYTTGYDEAVCTVEDFQSADVAPVVHGHWEHVAYDKYRCSVCGTETTVDTFFDYPLYKGCPYCLAIMDGKDGKADGTI